jgi:uncharacterized protein (DUF58 family)
MVLPPEIAVELNDLIRLEYLVNDFSLLPKQPVHSVLSGKHASKLRGRGLDFSEVRKYVKGDDIRNIDWKVTARTQKTHTKVFNEEKERPSFMVIDQSSSMFFASKGSVKSVMAAKLAAIAGYKVLKAGDRIGGLVFNDEDINFVPAKRSRKTLMHLLEYVVDKNQKLVNRKKMADKTSMFNQALFKTQNLTTHDYVVTIISDFKNLDEQSVIYLTNIARHNDVIAIVISDPMENEIPKTEIPVSDGDFQLSLKGDSNIAEKFKDKTTENRLLQIDYFRKHRIPFMEINTHEDLISQIKNIFGRK